MITGRDAGKEARRLDDMAKAGKEDSLQITLLRAIVKGLAVVVKVLVTIRGNQVAIMKHEGIQLRAPETKDRDSSDTAEGKK